MNKEESQESNIEDISNKARLSPEKKSLNERYTKEDLAFFSKVAQETVEALNRAVSELPGEEQ